MLQMAITFCYSCMLLSIDIWFGGKVRIMVFHFSWVFDAFLGNGIEIQ